MNAIDQLTDGEHPKTIKTTCPYCGVGCGVLATPQQDGTLKIEGDKDHPANFGRLCSKGSALGETIDLDGRLLYPEVSGEVSSWDNALDLVADKFKQTIAEYGPDSVAFYVSGQILTEDYYIANKLMKGFIGSANIDTNSRLCMASSVAGHRKAFGTDTVPGHYEDLEQADLLALVGSNLAWCHPVIYQRVVAAKAQRPHMKIVLIDPRRTMTSDVADLHLPLKADGDVPLFLGLLNYLSQHDTFDKDYIETHTNGFDSALKTATAFSLETVSQQTGLSVAQIEEFYALFNKTEKAVTVYSQGVNQSKSGTDKVSSIINCHLATGRIGKEGMGPFSVTGQPNAMGGREVGGLANMLACHMDIENEAHRDLVKGFWQAPTIADKAGLKAVDMFDAVHDGRVKAIWIMATNPVDSLPNANKVEEALKNCPFVVVSDVLKETDTVRHAHVKLPSAAWAEKDGTVTNSERRISRQRGFLPLPGAVKPDWWQFGEVAKRMGFHEAFDYNHVSDIYREYAALSGLENNDSRDFDISAQDDIAIDDYNAIEPFQWPYRKGESQKQTRFFANGKFYTPDRKARFVNVNTTDGIAPVADRPLTLNTGRIRDQWHTMTRTAKAARLSQHIAEPFCEIHPEDALKYGISDADLVDVTSEFGQIRVRALITNRVQKGAVFVPMHWTDQFASTARVDTLVAPITDPFSGQPALKNVPISLKSAELALYGFAVVKTLPDTIKADYWAKAICDEGWRIELGFEADDIAENIIDALGLKIEDASLSYVDETISQTRYAWFDGENLIAALYLAPKPVAVSRVWAVEQLGIAHADKQARFKLVAGRPGQDQPDRGAIVCSCFSVGANEIAGAVRSGCRSVDAIGKELQAGTNCGSCRAEINDIIEGIGVSAPIAAE